MPQDRRSIRSRSTCKSAMMLCYSHFRRFGADAIMETRFGFEVCRRAAKTSRWPQSLANMTDRIRNLMPEITFYGKVLNHSGGLAHEAGANYSLSRTPRPSSTCITATPCVTRPHPGTCVVSKRLSLIFKCAYWPQVGFNSTVRTRAYGAFDPMSILYHINL